MSSFPPKNQQNCLFVCNRGNTILHHGRLHTDLNQCNQGSLAKLYFGGAGYLLNFWLLFVYFLITFWNHLKQLETFENLFTFCLLFCLLFVYFFVYFLFTFLFTFRNHLKPFETICNIWKLVVYKKSNWNVILYSIATP